ncbi:major facilitator superfamily domain-containing protein [Phaeosphaeria sp. MPI-PUGE-AT-0046c]|nr:major facilitator superfamily domain-containing protein [Phaeosphaeria sp. MPI-PUGE-AT-0046c]
MANPTPAAVSIAHHATPIFNSPGNNEKLPVSAIDDASLQTSSHSRNAIVSPPALPPAPNGGLQAWMQVFMGHLVLINGWGYLSSFGLFQAHYTETLQATPSAISWIGSMQIFLVYLVGTFSGRALDAGYYHKTIAVGSLLQIVAVFTTSVSTQYWQLFLAQGVCKGLGDGLVFCPTVSLVATYFTTRRSLAMAITASGGATGGIIFPLIAQQMLPTVGFGWTVRTMAFVILFNTVIILCIARVRLPPRKTGPIVEWSAFQEPSYMLFCIGMFFNLWAVYFAYFYLSSYAKNIIGVSSSEALTLLLVMNALGVPGRVVCGLIADRLLGPVNTLIPVAFFAGVLFYCWAAVNNVGSLYAFCVLYGFFGAGIQSLFPASCASLTTDLSKMGVRTGMCFSFISIACLTGPPIAGALIQLHNGHYLYAQVFGGSAFIGGTCTLIAARIAKTGLDFRKRM